MLLYEITLVTNSSSILPIGRETIKQIPIVNQDEDDHAMWMEN